jgi:hypothetical protein
MRAALGRVLLAAAIAGCASSETGPPATGAGGTAQGGSSGSAGTGGSAAAGGDGGTAAGGGGGAGGGGTIGGTGGGGAGGTGTAGGSGRGGGAGGQGGRGGAGAGGQGGRGGAGGRGGGGGGTAGAGGTGTAGTVGTGGAASGCAGKTYKLCEDFETGTVGAFPTGWTALNGFGADSMRGVGLATDQFRSGAMALKSSSMVPGEQRVQRSLSALGATATKHWGRIFYRVVSPAPRPPSGVIHVTLAALQGTTENRVVDTVEQMNGTHQWLFNIPDDSCCTGSAYNWSFDNAWHCAEWYVDVSAQAYRFFSDGSEVTSIGFTGRAAARMSSYTALAVGAIFYQAPPSPFTIWFDDLAIDDSQIGCQ